MSRGRFGKNASVLMLMELGIRGMDAVVVILLARYLAPERFGLLAFALAFAGLFGILPGFGMGSLSIRNVAREPHQLNRFLMNGLIVKTGLTAVTLFLIWLVSSLFHHSPERREIVMWAGLLMVLETNVGFVLSFFQARERMTTTAVVNLSVRLGWVVSSLFVMFFRGGIIELLAVRVAVTAVGLLAALFLVHLRLERLSWNFDPAFAWNILRASVPFALFRVWMQLYPDVDMVMISTMRGDLLTSLYAVSQKVMRLFAFIPAGFGSANLPEMARSSRESRTELVKMIARRCKYLMIISLAIAGGVFVAADWIILLLYGKAYEGAESVLRIGIWSLVFTFMNGTLLSAIAAVDREHKGSNRLFVGLLFSVLSNFLVIPLFGPEGAAATTVMSRALIFYLEIRLLREVLPDLKFLNVGRLLFAAAFMITTGWLSRSTGFLVSALVCAAVYSLTLVLTQAINRHEWSSMMKLLRWQSAE